MPIRKRRSVSTASSPSFNKKDFWQSETLNTPVSSSAVGTEKSRISEQISRLQQRQMELVQQTALELEDLKRQVEESRDYEQEITALRGAVQRLEQEKSLIHSELLVTQQNFEQYYTQIHRTLHGGDSVRQPAAQLTPATAPTAHSVHRAAKLQSPKKLVTRTLAFGLVASLGFWGFTSLKHGNAGENGQVAGVSTTAPSANPAADGDLNYPQSYADIPYAQTEWTAFADPDFNFSLLYPKNATARIRAIGSDNVYFPRKDHILAKFTKEDTVSTLDEWWNQHKAEFNTGYTVNKGTLGTKVAYIIKPVTADPLSGTEYIFRSGSQIIRAWFHDEDPKSDDGQRLTKMLSSIQFPN